MRCGAVLFDLDGTLVDPKQGLLDSFVHGLAAVGVKVDDPSTLEVLIGPPLHYGLTTYLGLTEPSLSVAVEAFRHHLGTQGVLEYEPYPGIPDLLAELQAGGAGLAVVTSKAAPFAELVLDHVGLRSSFAVVSAASLSGTDVDKDQLVHRALQALRAESASAVVVGDREFDIFGARAHDTTAIGVTWGYGDRAELEAAGADHVVDSVDELRALLLSRA